MKRAVLLLLLIILLSSQSSVLAQSAPSCSFQADGSILCTTGGGNEGGGEEGGGENHNNGGGNACVPGQHMTYQVFSYDPVSMTCAVSPVMVENCTGIPLESWSILMDVPCEPQSSSISHQHPCTTFSVGAGGITCANSGWNVSARVNFPEIYLDVRPYPATLVRWPTFIRNGGLPESSGSGSVNYISNGGGSAGNPRVGDWQNLRLILTLRPAGPMFVTLPHIGDLMLPTGAMQPIQWEVPSHPAAGATTLAGSVSRLDELPGDMPLFVGNGRAPYKLFWELRYQEYEAIEGCLPGPSRNGVYNCGGGTGHRGITGYEWKNHSSGGEIPPSAVANLPSALMADINNDGTPDAYWDNNLTLRRMDEAGSVSHPQYRRSWNWGGIIYWAVREGQGQIGWPGQ
jgi:hypothetical protein